MNFFTNQEDKMKQIDVFMSASQIIKKEATLQQNLEVRELLFATSTFFEELSDKCREERTMA